MPDGIRGRLQQVAEPDEDADLADEQAEDGSHFHDAAGEPHAGGPHDVLDDSLFGRAEDGGLHGKDAEPQDGPVQIVDAQAPVHARQHAYLEQGHEFSSALAEKAIEICGVFLLRAYLDGSDMHARKKMHVASCLAGLSFNTAGLGITHSMAHQLGAMFHIPHGRANAMLLPHIVEFNSDINKHSKSQKEYLPAVKRYANVAHILGLSNYNKVMTVRSLVNWIQFMQKEMNIPLTIQELGTIAPEEYFAAIDKMADAALADACTVNNPRVPTKEDIIKIYTKLWSF